MQLMLQCMLRPKFFEDTFENTQWKKSNNATSVMIMKRHLKMHRGETVKKGFLNPFNGVCCTLAVPNVSGWQKHIEIFNHLFDPTIAWNDFHWVLVV